MPKPLLLLGVPASACRSWARQERGGWWGWLHSHACVRIGCRGGKGRCDRGVGVHRRGAAAARRVPPRARRGRRHRHHAGRRADRRPLPEPGGRLRRPGLRGLRPRWRSTGSTSCSSALPHGESQKLVPELVGQVGRIVDLAADFRLQDPALYPQWYGEAHTCPELLADFAYGLPELFRREILSLEQSPRPGCYPTAAALALAPLVRAGLVETTGIVVDAASGVSGAGRPPKPNTTFCTVDEDFTAYGLLDHRHTPEIEQVIGAPARLHAAPRPDEPRHPRHLLRPARRRPLTTGDAARRAAGRLRRRAVRRGPRRLAVDQGDAGLEHRPRDGWSSTRAPAGSWPSRPSTTSSRGRPARRCSAPTCSSASPRPPASPPRGCTRERHGARGLRRRGRPLRHQGVRRPRPLASWPPPPAKPVDRGGRVHRRTR